MKKISIIITAAIILNATACVKDDDFLDVDPTSIIAEDVAFSDPKLVLSVLADLYNRYYDFSGLDNGWASFADFSESFPSENGSSSIVQNTGWGYSTWNTWDYTYIHDLNLFIERDSAATELTDDNKARFLAEGRFLRASYYFEMVKRMGGVPLITSSVEYDAAKGVEAVQFPRAKESDIYDFVISEAEAIKDDLPADVSVKSRASKGAALAMESRAALYAGSIAKYGASTPTVSLSGGEVGIAADKANDYYTIALRAASEIINGEAGAYSLYNKGGDLSTNFANLFLDKDSPETIFFEDFETGGKTHAFTTNDQPYSLSEEGGDAGRLNPSLNFAESFEKLDGTYAPFTTTDASGNPVYYDDIQDIFADRDARLAGTILLPGGTYKGGIVDIWAGYVLPDGSIVTSDQSGTFKSLYSGGPSIQVVGEDGPVNGLELRTQTGFYIRKYIDQATGSGTRGLGSTVAFIRYRYAEILLNAAEASFELGDNATAATYLNQVRARAGLTVALTASDVTFDRIVHDRRVELAFEGHILFDYKRWRIAAKVWDGQPTTLASLTANIGIATKRSTQPWGLWPYRHVDDPTKPNDFKWMFKETLPALATGYNRFLSGNYYSQIPSDAIASNPKLIQQPNQ
ncbi:RagB/SusD family nutrient uptake outer membrane protein [Parafilimonas sp.]|uniref:RagB/SusD family nutrient uptake outer membrane protein n=1 Tax=Parafilimonas sp. TaxID=1969739 RepID=UPI0039E46361